MLNSKLDKIIGIDLSLNSPGFCVLKKDSCDWISLHRTSNSISKMLQKDGSPFKELSGLKNFSINVIEKKEYVGEYHDKERQKILNAIYFSDKILDLLKVHIDENSIIGMEGLSFGSRGNSLIDISMTTSLVRASVVKLIDPNNFFVIPPTTIKKFAIKGNAKKNELYESLLDKKKEDIRIAPFYKILNENKDRWIKGSGKVEDPCSDLIDATWLSLYIEENIEKLLNKKLFNYVL
jgi:hypothetical protein